MNFYHYIDTMKRYYSLWALALFLSMGYGHAQIGVKPAKTVIPQRKMPTGDGIAQKLTFNVIRTAIKKGGKCYRMGVATSFVEKQGNALMAGPQVAYAMAGVDAESNYLRSNFMLLRSDKQFSRAYGNTFEIILNPDRNGEFDPNNVKLTWRFPDLGVKTFLLEHVTVQQLSYGVTLSGDAMIDGKKILAVSIALAEVRCLL